MELLRTDRVRLRPWADADAPRLLDIQSRREIMQWLDDDFADPTLLATLDDALARIARYRTQGEPGGPVGYWAIEELATGVVGGTVLVVPLTELDPEAPSSGELEIGWHLHPDAQGRGLAREAAAALLTAALAAGRGPVHALLFPDNEASAQVCAAIGMVEQPVSSDRWYPGPSRHFVVG